MSSISILVSVSVLFLPGAEQSRAQVPGSDCSPNRPGKEPSVVEEEWIVFYPVQGIGGLYHRSHHLGKELPDAARPMARRRGLQPAIPASRCVPQGESSFAPPDFREHHPGREQLGVGQTPLASFPFPPRAPTLWGETQALPADLACRPETVAGQARHLAGASIPQKSSREMLQECPKVVLPRQ